MKKLVLIVLGCFFMSGWACAQEFDVLQQEKIIESVQEIMKQENISLEQLVAQLVQLSGQECAARFGVAEVGLLLGAIALAVGLFNTFWMCCCRKKERTACINCC
ncbi:hypothetical protein K2X40_03815 [Candidatus Babeliales bacterium]|nr:hypothetical protein [Candidatus Babeliales bacterium]